MEDMQDPGKKVQDYRDQVIKEGEKMVKDGFPKRIVRLNEILQSKAFNIPDLLSLHSDLKIPVPQADFFQPILDGTRKLDKMECSFTVPGTNVYVLPCGTVPANDEIVQMINVVKPLVRQLVEDANLLKIWVSFLIPKIEDGNNFGVSIQEDTLAEIRVVESEAAAFYDQISKYFCTRGKIISKVAKYPHIEDYRKNVQELDEKEYLSLRLILMEVRNHYATLHDFITKNIEKIQKPRSANMVNMY
ncbi:unnamed protein product [Darwinula stevensoni]|uniref:Proteasome activator complex subunit 3 n=1 Tax=Darwinula stevensoni TaxID=69355 RepID=A0A7R9ADT1_9CRUS|nr:unnamed protein product [Darwinula stevensoni]CAG0901610.1 unnamed protein product [Darwinula stevensoni]